MNPAYSLYKYLFGLLFLLQADMPAQAFERPAEKTKTWQKSFALQGVSLFEISNQFGDVHINNGTASEARVEVEMIANGKSDAEAQELLDKISIEESTGSTLAIATRLQKFNGNNGSHKKVTINYKVWLPASMAIRLTNQFGNLVIPDWKGRSNITVKFGDLIAGHLADNEQTVVEFGKMNVKAVTGGKIDGQYSKVVVAGINGHVRVNFDFCNSPEITVGNDFESLNVANSYSSIKLFVPADYKGKFDIRTSFSNLKNNSAFAIKEDGDPDRKGPRFDKDYLGSAGTDSTLIKVKSSFGDVTIKN